MVRRAGLKGVESRRPTASRRRLAPSGSTGTLHPPPGCPASWRTTFLWRSAAAPPSPRRPPLGTACVLRGTEAWAGAGPGQGWAGGERVQGVQQRRRMRAAAAAAPPLPTPLTRARRGHAWAGGHGARRARGGALQVSLHRRGAVDGRRRAADQVGRAAGRGLGHIAAAAVGGFCKWIWWVGGDHACARLAGRGAACCREAPPLLAVPHLPSHPPKGEGVGLARGDTGSLKSSNPAAGGRQLGLAPGRLSAGAQRWAPLAAAEPVVMRLAASARFGRPDCARHGTLPDHRCTMRSAGRPQAGRRAQVPAPLSDAPQTHRVGPSLAWWNPTLPSGSPLRQGEGRVLRVVCWCKLFHCQR